MEFVGHDVCTNGNRPAQSKHSLVKAWPKFKVARDISSFLGFMNFYSMYIPYFEQRVAPLRALAKLELDTNIEAMMEEEHHKAREDMMMAILSDPCLARYDCNKRPYLSTDFSKMGFGYNLCQPADDPDSLAAMHCEIEGGEYEFSKAD